ncbi:MAG TPA: phosphatase PAP2 family protein [Pseudolabrys sp.]|nr:phosphatase PAP2 family protein [Pseudolabrys sp.]
MAKTCQSDGGDLRKRIDESFVQFYFLLLGISQNVILGLFLAHLAKYPVFAQRLTFSLFVSDQFWHNAVSQWATILSALHALLLILGLYYAYYWYTLYYRRPLSFIDVVLPVFLAISQMIMVEKLDDLTSYMVAVAFFYLFSVLTLRQVYSYTRDAISPAPNVSTIFKRGMLPIIKWSIMILLMNSVAAMVVAILIALLKADPRTQFVFCIPMFAMLISYHFWTLRFMRYVAHSEHVREMRSFTFDPRFAAYLFTIMLVFVIFFYGAYFIVLQYDSPAHSTFLEWDSALPTSPYAQLMYAVYYSAFALPVVLHHCLKSSTEMRRWAYSSAIVIILAAITFIVYPTIEPTSAVDARVPDALARILHGLDYGTGLYNLFPSLHVALCMIATVTLCRTARPLAFCSKNGLRGGVVFWFLSIVLATLFTHKHSIIDVIGGLAYGAVAIYLGQLVIAKMRTVEFRWTSLAGEFPSRP